MDLAGGEGLPRDAAIHASVRGPSFPEAYPIKAPPEGPIPLPVMNKAGTHFVEDIRLDLGDGTVLPARPRDVVVNVLDELLSTSVSSRPLTLEEIRELGIQYDENSFKFFNFTVAFTTESGVVEIEMPVALPTTGSPVEHELRAPVSSVTLPRSGNLPPLELANVFIKPVMLQIVERGEEEEELPPIPGIIVIPGNVGFLNQFFSVLLAVSNEAPDGTPLVVRDLQAEIRLPAGADGVVGDLLRDPPFAPGEPEYDNPLRIAETAAGRENVKPVVSAGADGKPGTSDDTSRLGPQGSGNAEFLVEGVREGGHVIEIDIKGVLEGLPGGPVEVAGVAEGAVVVRDPNFSLTFIHPDTVRAGEAYDLTLQLHNTSQVPANLLTVSLDPRNMTGARLLDETQATQVVDTVLPGESGTVTFRLEAMRTGQVTASTLELSGAEGHVSGRRVSLRAGVGELGQPLSPDTLILPKTVNTLRQRAGNDDLTFRALALLGQAHSISTSPRGSLPPDVWPIAPSTVQYRARELAEAGRRLELSVQPDAEGKAEPRPDGLLLTLEDLLFDFLGAGESDSGWDSLYRSSRQARLFAAALLEVAIREGEPLGLADHLALQGHWSRTEHYRDAHISVVTQAEGGDVPVLVHLGNGKSRGLGGLLHPDNVVRELPGADVVSLERDALLSGQLAILTRTDAGPYVGTLAGRRSGRFDLGVVALDDTGELVQVVYRGVAAEKDEQLYLEIHPGAQNPVRLEKGGVRLEPSTAEPIADGPPEVLGVVQDDDWEIETFGQVVAVLYSEDVDGESAREANAYAVSRASIPMIPPPPLEDGNEVVGAAVQFGGRIVLIGLRDPVGPFVPRDLSVAGVEDLRGHAMTPGPGVPIFPDPELAPGALVTGQVLSTDGQPLAGAQVGFFKVSPEYPLALKNADEQGRYSFDYLSGFFGVMAKDTETGDAGHLFTQVGRDGERLRLDIVVRGRGRVEGTVRDEGGAPVPQALVELTSTTMGPLKPRGTDQHGRYHFDGIDVGAFGVRARSASGGVGWASGAVTPGQTTFADVTLQSRPRVALAGEVRHPDGTVAPAVEVYIASGEAGGQVQQNGGFFGRAITDEAGTFLFDELIPGPYRLRALDQAQGLLGDARTSLTEENAPDNPGFVRIVLTGTGSVAGTVYRRAADGLAPVAGALVGGGLEVVTADAEGRYFLPAVPVGVATINAADTATGMRGQTNVTILVTGQASTGIDIVLETVGSVTGRVLDPQGVAVAGVKVTLVVDETPAYFVFRTASTGSDGVYLFDRVGLGEYPLTARRGGEIANAHVLLTRSVPDAVVDLRLEPAIGRVAGRVVDESGLDVAAKVAVSALAPNAVGMLEFGEVATVISDPDRGFDIGGLHLGPYAVTATSFFAPEDTTVSGVLTLGRPTVEDLVLTLAKNRATLRGCVLDPEGEQVAPVLDAQGVPLPLPVFVTSGALRTELSEDTQNPDPDGIRVDASEGCFEAPLPLPPDYYLIRVTDERAGSPTLGLSGEAHIDLEHGEAGEQDVRLLGLGAVRVEVVDASGVAVPGVEVVVQGGAYPPDRREALLLQPTDVEPAVFEGLAEGAVTVSATVSTDPAVDVGGREELRGFGGNASGTVVRGAQSTLTVVLQAAGAVRGRFLRPDGVTPVPNAQVELVPGGSRGRILYDVTDEEGRFGFTGIPQGFFSLRAKELSTLRWGEVRGSLDFDGQILNVDVVMGPIGRIQGTVLDADRAPVAQAEVTLEGAGPTRHTGSGLDGSFGFASVPGGPFTLTAVSPDRLGGRAEGELVSEGEVVAVVVRLEGNGRVEGTLFDAFGEPAPSADVTLKDSSDHVQFAQTGLEGPQLGRYAFDTVPIGPFQLEARPTNALTPGDGAEAQGAIDAHGQIAVLDLQLQGTISVGVTASGEIGAEPVEVSLVSLGVNGGSAFPTSVQDGVHLFEGIPRAPFTATARQLTPSGVTISASASLGEDDLPPPGQRLTPDVELVLTPMATVRGTVFNADGTAASGARVSLHADTFSVRLTGQDGTFAFLGIPTDVPLRLDVEGVNGGLAAFVGRIDAEGQVRDVSDQIVDPVQMILDVDPPEVASVVPAAGAAGVPTSTTVKVGFSEPVDPASLVACPRAGPLPPVTFVLVESTGVPPVLNDPLDPCDDSNVVPADLSLSPDALSVTLTPRRELVGATPHTLQVRSGSFDAKGNLVGGVRDRIGRVLEQDFISSFQTRDNVPPFVLSVSPADGARDVALESVVRVALSEPIDPRSVSDATFGVTGPSGPVSGRRDTILGNTVLVFTPTDAAGTRALLESDATYGVTVAGLVDPAGNVQRSEASISLSFQTLDTVAPTIGSIVAPAGARFEQSFTATAVAGDDDVASVSFFVDGFASAVVTTPTRPGEFETSVEMPNRAIEITARATDRSGNLGPLSDPVTVVVLPDEPPTLTILVPAEGTTVAPGTTVHLEVEAEDDVGVSEVQLAASGAATASLVQPIDPPEALANVALEIDVPSDAAAAELVLAAVAIDTRGQTSTTASRTLAILDETDPSVSFETPAEGAVAAPGLPLDVTVTAFDQSGIVEVSLEVPELSFAQATAVEPAAVDAQEDFVVPVPDPLEPVALTLVARATDRYGRVGVAQTTVVVLSFDAEVEAARGLAADPGAPSANVGQTLRLVGRGLTDSLVARFAARDDDGFDTSATSPLFAVEADGSAASVLVPADTVTGTMALETESGDPLPGEALLQIVPTLGEISLPPGESLLPGVVATLLGSGFDEGRTWVDFPGVGEVEAEDVSASNSQLTVTIPDGVTSGDLFVLTDGGQSNGYPILGAFGFVATATEGQASDSLLPSANVGQSIRVVGDGLSSSFFAIFTATDDSGAPATVEARLSDVSPDGAEARVQVPVEAVTGAVRVRPDTGEPFPAVAALQVVPTLASLQVAGGQPLEPGVRATLVGSGFHLVATQVVFTGVAPVVPESVLRSVLTVTVPDGVTSGSVEVVTDGGASRALPLPGAFGLTALAARGTPANATEASANAGQTVSVSGEDLSDELLVVFPGVDDDGESLTLEAPLVSVAPDGTSASVSVPPRAATGPVRLRHEFGALSGDSALLQVVPTLSTLEVPGGQVIEPGVLLTLRGSGFVEGATEVEFPAAGRVPAEDVLNSGTTLVVTIPDDLDSGPLTAVTTGGTSNALTIEYQRDAIPPEVVEVVPVPGATGVPVNTTVSVRFSEPIEAATVNDTTVTLSEPGGPVAATLELTPGATTLIVRPLAALVPSTAHTLTLRDIEDLAGNPLAAVFESTFTTGSQVDVTPPSLVRVTPSGEAVGVNAVLVAEFSEAIDPASVDASTVRLQNGTTGEFVEVDWSVSGSVVYVVPTLVLSVGTYYTLYLEASIEDLSGNALTWSQYRSFRTGFGADVTGPEVVGVDPPEGSLGVATNGRVTVGLSEALDPISVSGSSVFLESDGGGVVEGQLQLENGNRRVVLTPTAHLDPETGYTVTVSGVRDIAGNALSGAVTSGFVTGLGADLVSPQVVGVSPESGTTGVARDVVVRVELSEAVNALTVDETSVYLQEYYGAVAETAVVVDASRRVILVTPLELLKANTQYQLRLQSGVKDTAGNSLSTYYPTFTTGELSGDTVPPEVMSLSPPEGALDVPVNARVMVRLSEAVDRLTVTPGTVRLETGGGAVEASVSLSEQNRLVTLTPAQDLAVSTSHEIVLEGVRDISGNALARYTSSFWTGASSTRDVTPPWVVETDPAGGASDVTLTPVVRVTFSERVSPSSVSAETVRLVPSGVTGRLPATVSLEAGGTVARLVPGVSLLPERVYGSRSRE